MVKLTGELGREIRAWHRQRRAEAWLRRGLLLIVPLFAVTAHAGLQGWVSRPLAAVLFPLVFAVVVMLSFVMWPVAPRAEELDRDLDARDALATLLLDDRPRTANPVLARFALERVRRTAPRTKRKRRKLIRRLLALAVLLLLAIWFFPGHAPLPGPGSAAGGGATPGSVARGGTGGGGRPTAIAPRDRGAAEGQRDPRSEPDAPERDPEPDAPDTEEREGPPQARRPEPKIRDHVVFPDFRGQGRSSEREAPRIDRSPGPAPGQKAARGAAGDPGPLEEPPEDPEWEKQKERALTRGRLAPWEGRFLEYWGRALETRGARVDAPKPPKEDEAKKR